MSTKSEWLDSSRPCPDIRTEAIPGPLAQKILDRDARFTSPSLPRAYPLVPQRAAGCAIEDPDGNLFLDFNAGIAVNSTGHAHPTVVKAVQDQAAELFHYSASDFYLPIYSQMCEALAQTAPMDEQARVFLTNSGTEAVEGALKLARYATKRQYIISFYGAFHGRSYGAVTLTSSKPKYHRGFGPLLPGVYKAPFAPAFTEDGSAIDPECSVKYIRDVLFRYEVAPDEVAAIFVEPVQGEGGYIVPPVGWTEALRALCDEYGILLVADEVQSGAGRTGKMWAIEHTDAKPDILLTAKGIASGLPLGAFIARDSIMSAWGAGTHGTTYGGSPIPCAAGLATLQVIREEGLLQKATQRGALLLDGLRQMRQGREDVVTDVRGLGLMIGVEMKDGETAAAVQDAAFRAGLLVLECGESSIRMSPPLIVTEDQCATALRIFTDAVDSVRK